ncbi:MAG TPA: hypothetical protein VK432_09600 [Stellaceae bacterium]|nr:hypothetical protein [Stellaceae bacterium]
MTPRKMLLGAALLTAASVYAGSAYAFTEEEIVHLHTLCVNGDRDACARRDAAIHDRDHEAEWRQRHPEWYR